MFVTKALYFSPINGSEVEARYLLVTRIRRIGGYLRTAVTEQMLLQHSVVEVWSQVDPQMPPGKLAAAAADNSSGGNSKVSFMASCFIHLLPS